MIRDTSVHVSLGYYWCSDTDLDFLLFSLHHTCSCSDYLVHMNQRCRVYAVKNPGEGLLFMCYIRTCPPLKGVALKPFWSKNGYRFFWNSLV